MQSVSNTMTEMMTIPVIGFIQQHSYQVGHPATKSYQNVGLWSHMGQLGGP